jgi:NAD(P)-dependent dehydrogenase (short-subunit alcohol dehydrogenase family)
MAAQTLDGKVVVIGGGAKNLGGLISRTFGAEGARIVVHYNSDATASAAEETVKAVKESGGDAFAIQGDLTRVPEVARLFDETVRRYGTVNIAINTVGKVLKKPIIETTEDEYDEMFAVNSKAAYFFIREAAKRIPDNNNGKIITVLTSLLAAFTGLYSTYAAARRRSSISRGQRPKSSGRAASRSTMLRPDRWTRRSSSRPRARTRSPITSPRA